MSKKTRKRLVSNKRLMLIKNFYLNKYKHCDKDMLNAIDHFFSQKKTEEVFLFMLNNFDDFFSDKGIYLNFIDADKSEKNAVIIPSANKTTIGIVITVLQSNLKEKLVQDQIIK